MHCTRLTLQGCILLPFMPDQTELEIFNQFRLLIPFGFTNPEGVEIGLYFGENDGGFPGNPRGTVNRFNNGTIFQSPTQWTSMVNDQLSSNNLKSIFNLSSIIMKKLKGIFTC